MLPARLVSAYFFEALANLFYAVAVADKVLVLDEKKAIFKEISNFWVYNVDGNSSTDIMYAHLRQLIHEATESNEALDEFRTYYTEHELHFSVEIKKAIFDSVNVIAGAYSNKNKSELGIIDKLRLLFS